MEKGKWSTRGVGKMQVQAIAKDKVEITQHKATDIYIIVNPLVNDCDAA